MTHTTLQDGRFPFALLLGAIVALALFSFMQRLVAVDHGSTATLSTLKPVTLLRVPPHLKTNPVEQPSRTAEEPQVAKHPALTHPVITSSTQINRVPLALPADADSSTLEPITGTPGMPRIGSGGGGEHSALGAKIRVSPLYPPQAAVAGVAGSVMTCFTVAADGSVISPRVEGASTPAARRLLGQAALRTIRQWQFFPRIVDGKAVATGNVCQDIVFKLK